MRLIRNIAILFSAASTFVGCADAFSPSPGTAQLSQRHHCPRVVGTPPSPHRERFDWKKADRSVTTKLNANLSPAVDIALISGSIAILTGYHINLYAKEMKPDTKTWRQYQADTREEWSRHVRETEGWLYAIQSLRNAITAQTFLASTVLSLLTLITGRMWDLIRAASNRWERRLLVGQLASISVFMLMSSYQFLQGVRLMTHAGFMFPVRATVTDVDNIMRKTQNCQWLGLRCMYIALAPIVWVVGGSRAFFAVSCMLFQFLRQVDKKPEGLGYEDFQGMNI
eukprot:CAMPEP_0183732330 /NCGR_PEP_ID=MMETSP0737-20130205/38188_1 /TAXON_ID=385413 /ORGANISM="Thalassiosira miniscula, Strain CCMP1093" /LENGTH=282 /DNA_ID=CAMNT_0025965315 /DNA_START=29 /DNA_END=877 /DNA_ORIENTATION=+